MLQVGWIQRRGIDIPNNTGEPPIRIISLAPRTKIVLAVHVWMPVGRPRGVRYVDLDGGNEEGILEEIKIVCWIMVRSLYL